MPLRDHFHGPLANRASWEGFHGQWPAMIVLALGAKLPPRYVAEPRVNLDGAEYEVRIFDIDSGRRLADVIKIISPANKGGLEHRRALVAECAALLQQYVAVTLVDVVTTDEFNFYIDLLRSISATDPGIGPDPSPLYVIATRHKKSKDKRLLESWYHALALGRPLPTIPVWLSDDLAVPLDLEECYEQTCRALRIP